MLAPLATYCIVTGSDQVVMSIDPKSSVKLSILPKSFK